MPTINISTHLKDMARQRPGQLAVLFPTGRDSAGRSAYTSYTYQRLDATSDLLAEGLRHIGIGRGVRTVLMVPPSLDFFALTFALFKAGAVPVFVDPGMGLKNIGKCLTEAQPEAFVGVAKAHVARKLFGWGRGSLRRQVAVGRGAKLCRWLGRDVAWWDGSAMSFWKDEPIMEAEPDDGTTDSAEFTIADTSADETAAILFTSGSTGVPKGAVYSHGNFVAQVEMLRRTFSIEPGEVDLCTFPLFALFATALGMTAIVPRMDFTCPAKVDPLEVSGPINAFQVANLFGSPALLNRVGRYFSGAEIRAAALDDEELAQADRLLAEPLFPAVRRVLSAGAPVSPAILERFSKLLTPGVQIFTPYGATESLPVAVIGSDEVLTETHHKTAQGAGTCVGRPVEGVHVSIIRITDEPILAWNDSLLMPRGAIGEIVVQGPQVTREYFNRPDLTALAKIRMPPVGRALLPVVGDMRRGQAPQTSELAEETVANQQAVTPPIRKSAVPDPVIAIESGEPGGVSPRTLPNEEQVRGLTPPGSPDSVSSNADIAHRMGDLGYFDEQGRLWFCGRKSHRIVTPDRTYFTEPVEGIFNAHPHVFRTALVGVVRNGVMQPLLCVELEVAARRVSKTTLTEELLALGAKFETTRSIQTILFHEAFPVDIRHNSKIFREKLAVWAAKKLR